MEVEARQPAETAGVADAAAAAAEHHFLQGLQGPGVRRRQRRQRLLDRLRPQSAVLEDPPVRAASRRPAPPRVRRRSPLSPVRRPLAPAAGGRGRGAAPGPPAPAPPPPTPPGASPPAAAPGARAAGRRARCRRRRRAGARAGGSGARRRRWAAAAVAGFANANDVFAISSGGMVHVLNVQTGEDLNPPIKFLPAGAKSSARSLVGTTLYAATTDNCGGAANGVYALDLASERQDRDVAGTRRARRSPAPSRPTFGTDGTLYVATGSRRRRVRQRRRRARSAPGSRPRTGSPAPTPFVSAPVVFQHQRQGPRSPRPARTAGSTCSTARSLGGRRSQDAAREVAAVMRPPPTSRPARLPPGRTPTARAGLPSPSGRRAGGRGQDAPRPTARSRPARSSRSRSPARTTPALEAGVDVARHALADAAAGDERRRLRGRRRRRSRPRR